MESMFFFRRSQLFGIVLICFCLVDADPEFCTRGFKMASRFYKCWEQATFVNKYAPLHEPHEYWDSQFLGAYATHMCSVVKPDALKCLKDVIQECSNIDKLMAMADQSGGACLGNRLNPFFKEHVIDRLVSIKSDSPCIELGDNTYECYKAAGQEVMQMGALSDNIVTFHRVADKFFNAYWQCMVQIYKSNEKICPHWQIPMLLTLQKTAMPSLFGLRLRPEQVQLLELDSGENADNETEVIDPGPSKLYLLLQLHKTRPVVSEHDESVVLELSDLNHDPHLELEKQVLAQGSQYVIDPSSLNLKELKKLLREQRRRNAELREFIKQAKQGLDTVPDEKSKKSKVKVEKKTGKSGGERLSLDTMVN